MPKVLCIEDESDFRTTLVDFLKSEGFETEEAVNGKQGYEKIISTYPDIILCDVSMPEMSGFDLLSELRANHPEKANIPFIFTTALGQKHQLLQGHNLGANGYIVKPIDFDILLSTMKSKLTYVDSFRAVQQKDMDEFRLRMMQLLNLELKTPLNVIVGLSNLMKLSGGQISPDKLKEFAERISLASIRLYSMIDNALVSTAILSGQFVLQRETVHLQEVIEEAMFAASVGDIDIQKKFALKMNDGSMLVSVDRQHLNRAMASLLQEMILMSNNRGAIEIQVLREGEFIIIRLTGEAGPTAIERSAGGFANIEIQFARDVVGAHNGALEVKAEGNKVITSCYLPV